MSTKKGNNLFLNERLTQGQGNIVVVVTQTYILNLVKLNYYIYVSNP